MSSNINVTDLDITFPVAGQDNDTQGFRTNFTVIKNNLNTAATEVTNLQANVALAALNTNVPPTLSSYGTPNQFAYDNNYVYFCVSGYPYINNWVKIPTTNTLTSINYGNVQVGQYLPYNSTIQSIQANVAGFIAGTGFATVSQLTTNVSLLNTNITLAVGNLNANLTNLINTVSANLVSYVNAANAAIITANTGMLSYVNSQFANINSGTGNVVTANTNMTNYVNAQISTVNTAWSANLTAANVAWQANAASQQTQINALNSEVYSNVTAVSLLQNLTSNVTTSANVTAGHVTTSTGVFWANGAPYYNRTTPIIMSMIFGG